MTNALRKAPQHTAVGFKQTVSGDGKLLGFSTSWVPGEAASGLGPTGTHSLFLLKVHKLLIVVELLLGEIPDRLQFRQPSLKRSLMPYFLLTQGTTGRFCPHSVPHNNVWRFEGAGSPGLGSSGDFCPLPSMALSCRLHLGRRGWQAWESALPHFPHCAPALAPSPINTFSPPAVRTGNLAKFNQVLDQFGDKFQADGTYTLIIRLRHNVIKTGRRLPLRWLGTPSRLMPQAWRARGCLAQGAPLSFLPRRCPYDQPLLFSHLPGGYCPETAAGQSGGCGVHRCQGSCI